METCFCIDVPDMCMGGVGANEQFLRDTFLRMPKCEQSQNLHLAIRQAECLAYASGILPHSRLLQIRRGNIEIQSEDLFSNRLIR